jgi:hypothetical protein
MSITRDLAQERTREYDTTRLTHLLLRAVGWVAVDDNDYELVKSPEGTTFPDRVRFVSEGCAIFVDADQVIGLKHAPPTQPSVETDEGARECVRHYTHDCQCPKHRARPAHDTRGFNPNEDR